MGLLRVELRRFDDYRLQLRFGNHRLHLGRRWGWRSNWDFRKGSRQLDIDKLQTGLHLIREEYRYEDEEGQDRYLNDGAQPNPVPAWLGSGSRARRAGTAFVPICSFQASGLERPRRASKPTPRSCSMLDLRSLCSSALPPLAEYSSSSSIPENRAFDLISRTCELPSTRVLGAGKCPNRTFVLTSRIR